MSFGASMRREDITGLLLAGGLSRRMGGGDKGLLLLGGATLASRALSALSAQCGTVLVSANRSVGEYAKLGCRVVSDIAPDFAGPLAGIHSGMTAAETEWILSAPCDSPFMPGDLASRLCGAAEAHGADIATARAGGRAHPVFMLARRSLLKDLTDFLEGGGRKIDAWRARHRFAEADFPDAFAFANINTPEELREMERRAGEN